MKAQLEPQFESLFADVFAGETGHVIVELRLAAQDVRRGGRFRVSFTRRVPCEICKGTGRKPGAPQCATCEGKRRKVATVEGTDVSIARACADCEGRGHDVKDTCDACEGGFTKVEDSAEVDVPEGSGAGAQLRIGGCGHIRPDKPQGDVIVVLGVDPATQATQTTNPKMIVIFLALAIFVFVIAVLSGR